MKYILNDHTDAAWNMAHDEFLLEGLQEQVFCLWRNAPAVIIGLNQSAYAEVNLPYLEAHGIQLARRVTGGGAVYHDLQNLNYSIAGPIREMENAFETMPAVLRQLGVSAERSGRNDILVDGHKCSGYAKRLSKDRMMIHGTLMWDVDIEVLTEALRVPGSKLEAAGIASVRSRVANLRDYLPQFPDILSFRDALHGILADGSPQVCLTPDQLRSIDRLADERFRQWEWIYGHSPSASFQSRRKFACGTVEVRYSLNHGVLENVAFGGDFLGNRPASDLAARLKGLRLEDLAALDVSPYFDALTPAEFTSLFS
ncbi:MAG: lipoate--protein ligase [Bacteroidales bacterium]|nr:lipoate--protein ligase [Bacteroidales bacterium]